MRQHAETHPPHSGYAGRPVTRVPPWHGLVAWDMFFNGLTTGLFLTAAISELMVPATFAPLAQVAYPLALVLLLIDLGCLVGDLGSFLGGLLCRLLHLADGLLASLLCLVKGLLPSLRNLVDG